MLVNQFDLQNAAAHMGQARDQWPLLNQWPCSRVTRAALEYIDKGELSFSLGPKPSTVSKTAPPLRVLSVRLACLNKSQQAQLRKFVESQGLSDRARARARSLRLVNMT